MNKWTYLSVVVLIGILVASLWVITKGRESKVDTESAAEQEIGVEEFDAAVPDDGGSEGSDEVLEPDLTLDAGEEDQEAAGTDIDSDSQGVDPDEAGNQESDPATETKHH